MTELMVAIGLMSVLISLLLPVMTKVRVAASSAKCASNLRQMGLALTLYLGESNGHAPEHIWHTPDRPDIAWQGYWPGILERGGISGEGLLCPAAPEPTGIATSMGYGDAGHCWTGAFSGLGTVVRLSDVLWRDASYGYNEYLTAGSFAGSATSVAAIRDFCHTPAFFDCLWVDAAPSNGSSIAPATPPPDLTGGQVAPGSPEQWKFLISRHGRGINVCMADGSVSWVLLEDTYTLSWNNNWNKYPLPLPRD